MGLAEAFLVGHIVGGFAAGLACDFASDLKGRERWYIAAFPITVPSLLWAAVLLAIFQRKVMRQTALLKHLHAGRGWLTCIGCIAAFVVPAWAGH